MQTIEETKQLVDTRNEFILKGVDHFRDGRVQVKRSDTMELFKWFDKYEVKVFYLKEDDEAIGKFLKERKR